MGTGGASAGSEPDALASAPAVTPNVRELINRLPAIVYVADAGDVGRWHYVGAQIGPILGFTVEEWRRDPTLWAHSLHPEDRERVINQEARIVEGDAGAGPLEYRMLRKDGGVVWIRDDAVLVRDEDGVERWHGVLSDITEQKQTEAELARRVAQQAAVARLGERALEGASPAELMQEAVARAGELLDCELGAVMELVPEERCLVMRASVGWPRSAVGSVRAATGTGSQSGQTILRRSPVVVTDWASETRFGMPEPLRSVGARSSITVTIEGTGGPVGVLGTISTRPRSFSSGDVDYLQALANVLADALERHQTEDQIRHRSLHDPLTGLPNRVLFLDRLELALARLERRGSLAAILFLDLDRFKLINDSLGHQVGDELLAAAAPRIKDAVRASDTVARFGGDEFGILIEDIGDERAAIAMAERIASVFTKPFLLAGTEHFVTSSIGIALARGGERPEQLIHDADSAMYRAKQRGSAGYELYDEAMRDRAIGRLRVENDLRRALERSELRLDYQPVVSLETGEIVSVEALARWDHPQRGPIDPGEFISVAEQAGLIEPIGRWVLEQACRDAVGWHRAWPDAAPVCVSVNLSAVQFSKRTLLEAVGSVLRTTGIDPACLSLEITESVVLRDAEAVSDTLQELKALGVRLVLDDFGTDYASLAVVTGLPIDVLKIDRSFVEGLGTEAGDTAITEAVIAMSRALSLEVVAEGVETPAQVAKLTSLGCGCAQGFHFSRPVTADDITRMLTDGPPWRVSRSYG
ncbi:MAG TPA: EAL domain-containing protein [Solirubrobacteraceae bacterium]|jgi:diguanylate cyclase (GGDEF)-like protein/PAS domain S-box-containing protein